MTNEFMLCHTIKGIDEIDINDYYGNLKYDGERLMAEKVGNKITLINRRGIEKGFVYPEIRQGLSHIQGDFVIDGEVITTDGLFNNLQRRALLRDRRVIEQRTKSLPVKYMVFDVLSIDGHLCLNLPLSQRKDLLTRFNAINIEAVAYLEGDGIHELWEYVEAQNKEGIILKKKDSLYAFKRSHDWLKLKNFKEQIIEFTAYYENNAGLKLTDGFYEVQMAQGDKIKEVKALIDSGKKVSVNVQYLEKTDSGKLRFPSCKEVLL